MDVKGQVQSRFQCCGFQNRQLINGTADFPSCAIVDVSIYTTVLCIFGFGTITSCLSNVLSSIYNLAKSATVHIVQNKYGCTFQQKTTQLHKIPILPRSVHKDYVQVVTIPLRSLGVIVEAHSHNLNTFLLCQHGYQSESHTKSFAWLQKICCDHMNNSPDCQCEPCMEKLKETIDYAFKLCGGIGLFFSFTEVLTYALFFVHSFLTMSLTEWKRGRKFFCRLGPKIRLQSFKGVCFFQVAMCCSQKNLKT